MKRLLAILLALSISACASAPTTFETRIADARLAVSVTSTTVAVLAESGRISAKDAAIAATVLAKINEAIDVAVKLQAIDPAGANAKLQYASVMLAEMMKYLPPPVPPAAAASAAA